MIVVYAEKPSVGVNLASVLGGCMINGIELTPKIAENKKYEQMIANAYRDNGYLECFNNGKKYVVTWGYGHMAELKKPGECDEKYKAWNETIYPYVPNEFPIKLKPKVIAQFNKVKKLFNDPQTEFIICGTDYDREGNLIFDYVYRLCNCKKPWKRLIIHSNEEKELNAAFKDLKSSSEVINTTKAGRCRAIADYLVGINLTALATVKYGGPRNVISIGRVQTSTLYLIVEREKAIKNFKKENYYEIEGMFSSDNDVKYKGKLFIENKEILKDKTKVCQIYSKIKECKNGIIIKYDKEDVEEKPPLLYDLTSLQMTANDKYGLTAAKTLEITQRLYEKKFVTYPRTNSRYLRVSMHSNMQEIIDALPPMYDCFKNKISINKNNSRVFNDKKVESHYAIIPTTKTPSNEELEVDEIKIYGLITRSIIKAFMNNAIWRKMRIETKVEEYLFVTTGRSLVKKGWREAEKQAFVSDDETEENIEDIIDNLPNIKENSNITIDKIDILTKETKPPTRFNDKTILLAMETAGKLVEDEELRDAMKDHGLGTPATRAAILDRLVSVNYVNRKGKKLIPTEKGIEIIDIFPIPEVKSPELTGSWEFRLSQVEKGIESPESFHNDIVKFTNEVCDKLKVQERKRISGSGLGKCPQPSCEGDIIQHKDKNGKVFFGCSNYKAKNCKFAIPGEICKKAITPSIVKNLLEKKITGKLKGFISKKDKEFEAKLKLEKDKDGNYNVNLIFK